MYYLNISISQYVLPATQESRKERRRAVAVGFITAHISTVAVGFITAHISTVAVLPCNLLSLITFDRSKLPSKHWERDFPVGS
jgi:hypothetical protein